MRWRLGVSAAVIFEKDANGVERKVGPARRLRARLAHAMYGQNAHIPKPTAQEYRELTAGDDHH